MAQLSTRGEAAIFDGDDERLFGVERGAYLACITVAQPGISRAAWNEAAIMEAGETQRPARSVYRHRTVLLKSGSTSAVDPTVHPPNVLTVGAKQNAAMPELSMRLQRAGGNLR